MLAQMSSHARNVDESKFMSFLIEDNKLQGKFNKIWDKFSNSFKKNLIENL